jgi:hypothetical protein
LLHFLTLRHSNPRSQLTFRFAHLLVLEVEFLGIAAHALFHAFESIHQTGQTALNGIAFIGGTGAEFALS